MEVSKVIADVSKLLARHESVLEFELVGSAMYHKAPKDVDFMVLIQPTMDPMVWLPIDNPRWESCGGDEYDKQEGTWRAIRQGHANLIVTNDEETYRDSVLAADVCATLHLQDKADRIRVFRVIRDRMSWEAARESI